MIYDNWVICKIIYMWVIYMIYVCGLYVRKYIGCECVRWKGDSLFVFVYNFKWNWSKS